ncbi:hypothetical protein KEJ27_04025 [Candidatus Bathyarchaeota archaeon]|nr:hypothetical protein [Candidatus Bathyarchaeota archaeon]MBS7613842.1 hypothetical protein [Candidatus Bathyarchaeota archaeon]
METLLIPFNTWLYTFKTGFKRSKVERFLSFPVKNSILIAKALNKEAFHILEKLSTINFIDRPM